MKNQRIAQAAMVMLLAASCSGGEEPEQAAPSDAVVENVTTTLQPRISGGDGFDTVAPTTTTPTAAPAPSSLAFASTKDIGRLFEAEASTLLYSAAGGELTGALDFGTLVQATSARSADSELWVRVRETSAEFATLGWVKADTLVPTTQSVATLDSTRISEFRSSRVDQDILSTAGGSTVVGILSRGAVGMHGGNTVLTSDGTTWVDVIDAGTRSRIGFVEGKFFTTLTSIEAQNDAGRDVSRRPDSSVTYGAPLSVATVTQGCNALQIRFASASSSSGTAIVFGTDVPVGRKLGSSVKWSAAGGSTVYVDPGESVTFTFQADASRPWYFAQLDAELQADSANPSFAGDVSEITATGAVQYAVERGSCFVEPVVVPEDEGTQSYFPEEELDSADVENDEIDALEDEELTDTAETSTTTTTTTTAVAPTTTTVVAAPTTTSTTTTSTTTTSTTTTSTTTTEAPAEGA